MQRFFTCEKKLLIIQIEQWLRPDIQTNKQTGSLLGAYILKDTHEALWRLNSIPSAQVWMSLQNTSSVLTIPQGYLHRIKEKLLTYY